MEEKTNKPSTHFASSPSRKVCKPHKFSPSPFLIQASSQAKKAVSYAESEDDEGAAFEATLRSRKRRVPKIEVSDVEDEFVGGLDGAIDDDGTRSFHFWANLGNLF